MPPAAWYWEGTQLTPALHASQPLYALQASENKNLPLALLAHGRHHGHPHKIVPRTVWSFVCAVAALTPAL